MRSLVFSTLAFPGRPLGRTLLLAASLREFGGSLADTPVWLFYPSSLGKFSEKEIASLAFLGVDLHPFTCDPGVLNFPLGTKAQAAAAAEKTALDKAEQLAWLDEDTLVLSPPEEFILPYGKSLAYRPVHHKLLGTSWGQEGDDFWQLVYRNCGASPGKDFQMVTHTGERIRPYFNAGSYTIRPDRGLLANWWRNFQSSYKSPDFKAYYEKSRLYAIFTHQAIFTGTVMAELGQGDLQALSPLINYPLHLHGEIPEDLRVERIDNLVTARYENILEEPGWQNKLPFSDALAGWLSSELDKTRDLGDEK